MSVLGIINLDEVAEDVVKSFTPRLAARGVVFDKNNRLAVLHVANDNHYKLPGGGIEPGEDKAQAFKRECLEEIGFNVEVLSELGSIVEYRSKNSMIQTSFCYTAKIIGEQQEITLTDQEKEGGFQPPIWVTLDEALRLISTSQSNNYFSRFMVERDTLILKTVKDSSLS